MDGFIGGVAVPGGQKSINQRTDKNTTTDNMATATKTTNANPSTARVKADKARIDRLKEQLRSTPQEIDFERVRVMAEVYEDTAGYQPIITRARFFAELIERKKLYIDDNLFVGSMASTVNGIYTYPEWNVDWMKEEKTVEKSKTPEDRKANEWALNYWEKRSLRPRTLEIFEKRYGFDPKPCYEAGLVVDFFSWPGGGGNLDYPTIYKRGLGGHDQGGQGAADGHGYAPAERLQVLLLRSVPDRHEGHRPPGESLCRTGPGDGGEGEGRHPQGGVDRHCRDLRPGARASGPQPARGDPVPLLLPSLRGNRAGRLRLFRGLPRPEPRAVLSGRQGRRADHL